MTTNSDQIDCGSLAFRHLIKMEHLALDEQRLRHDRLFLRCVREQPDTEVAAFLFSSFNYWWGRNEHHEAFRNLTFMGFAEENFRIVEHYHFPSVALDECLDPLLALLSARAVRRGIEPRRGSPFWLNLELEMLAVEAEALLTLDLRRAATALMEETLGHRKFARSSLRRWTRIVSSQEAKFDETTWKNMRELIVEKALS